MGKSAKFYKRPSKKEKESNAIKKIVEPSAISKKDTTKKISVPSSLFKPKKQETDEDVDMAIVEEKKPAKKEKKEKEVELPDYVDLFSGRKTYKKVPKKRK